MKKIIIFSVGVFVISTAVFGEVRQTAPEQPIASADQYPMLEDFRAVSITIDHVGTEPNSPPVNWARLQLQIARKLSEAGISIAPVKGVRLAGIPDLRATVMMVTIPETEQFVFHIETSLYRLVNLSENNRFIFSAPVWMSSATMQSVATADVDSAITKAALRHVGDFISEWKSAQTKASAAAEPNDSRKNRAAQNSKTKALTPIKSTDTSKETYTASKSSKVFHLADCAIAKTISTANLVTFASRDEAINSGRRPCKKCNP